MNNANNDEWVGGKQVYKGKKEPSSADDWLDEFTDDDLGFNVNPVGWKPKNRVVQREEEDENGFP